jgi:hypothetical protein
MSNRLASRLRAEPAQRVLDLGHDPAAGAATVVRIVVERHEELRGEHDVITAPLERLADDGLRLAVREHVGGVDEVDTGVERPVNDLDALAVVLGTPVAEHHRAQAQLADLDTGAAQRSQLHGGNLSRQKVE